MAYTINHTDGTTLIPGGLTDGTYDDSHTSIVLIGKDYAGYGQFLNENFVKMLENFSNTASPANPIKGQLWWDSTNNILKVYSGTTWKISTGATASPFSSPPGDLSTTGGDLWFDTTNGQLKVYTGFAWQLIGPVATPATGDTGAIPTVMSDTSSGTHIVIQFRFSGVVYAIFSKDTFNSALTGFSTVKAGINFSTVNSPSWVLSTQDTGATASTLVQRDSSAGITAAAITGTTITGTTITASSTINGTFSGNLSGNVTATSVSATSMSATGITASTGFTGALLTASQPNVTGLGNVFNLSTNGTTNFTGLAKYNGVELATMTSIPGAYTSINGIPVGNASPNTGAFTTLVVSSGITPVSNLVANVGSSTSWFNIIYGKSMQAQYADLAERFHSDAEYPAGTVVEMGGPNEITQVVEDLSETVFGVISSNAAYLMNSGAGTNATHPPVAMSGRVPVRAVGLIAKGDRLVSAGNGLARAGKVTEITPWNVIGRSLVDKTDTAEASIEAIVKINS